MIGFAATFLATSSLGAIIAFAGASIVRVLIAISAWRPVGAQALAPLILRGDQPSVVVGFSRVTPGALTCTS